MKIFIAPLNWGLGHATRLLPLIRQLIDDDHQLFIASSDRAGILLKKEVTRAVFVDFPDYPIKYPRSHFFITRFMLFTFPNMLIAMIKERRRLKALHDQYHFDLIISDNRFACRLKGVKSWLISHQLRYILPPPIRHFGRLPEYFNAVFFNQFHLIIVPDSETEDSLTAELSHQLHYIKPEKIYYSGIIADCRQTEQEQSQPFEYLVIISGPEPQRTLLENIIMSQISQLSGRTVIALGRPERDYRIRIGQAVAYTCINRRSMSRLIQQAGLIIARPGYTTVMEMVEFGKRGLFIPTPGQIEQEYLARYYMRKGWCLSVQQKGLKLREAVSAAEDFSGFPDKFSKTANNIQQLIKKINIPV